MRHLSIALAVVGVAASCAYCTAQVSAQDSERRAQEIRLCEKAGGYIASGWNGQYCAFKGEAE